MKLCLIFLSASFVCLLVGRLLGQPSSPVSVQMVSPSNGQIVSNTITLSATASSTAAPIQRVEFYVDGKLFKTVYAFPTTPNNLTVKR